MHATLSIIIPTRDPKRPLARALATATPQLCPSDEVIVVGDTHSGPLPSVEALVTECGQRYIAHDAGYHSWGNPQRNAGIAAARGDWLAFIDDDDAFTPTAFGAIRQAIAQLAAPRPLLFRFVTPWRDVLWAEKVVQQDRIGGHCAVVPNVPDRLGTWSDRYQGDFDFIATTLARWDVEPAWCEDIISVARPS